MKHKNLRRSIHLCFLTILLLAAGAGRLPAQVRLADKAELYAGKEYRQAFANPTDDPALPRVLLIGDSISIGYTVPLRKLLHGKANVHRISENGQATDFGKNRLQQWLGDKKWDLIHFNWGLWDLCYRNPESKSQGHRDKIHGTLSITPEQYRANLQALVVELKKTGARLIWCETTPVPDGEVGRVLGSEIEYNRIAREVMEKHGVAIDDLHAHAARRLPEIQEKPGDVHFTAEGYAYLAEHVAERILADLSTGLPNIVYILADDLGYGDVGCLNPKRGKIPTPRLDRLAAQGMTFTDSHSGSSVCTPTRYGLLTGRYAWRTRLQNGVIGGYEKPLIADDVLTVPAMLGRNGYHSACIGKWHLGFTLEGGAGPAKGAMMGAAVGATTSNGPVTRGFDEYFGFHHARMMKSVFENDRVTRIVEPVDMLPLLVSRSREYVKARAATGKPFFLYLALNSPHSPIVPTPEWRGKSGLGDYGDFVMETDWAVGEILDGLDEAGVSDNTLVVFTSDNGCSGPAADAKSLERQGHFASADFRGYKSDIWEGGHRVPFFVRWPGKVKPATHSAQLICHTDLMATCAEILGVKLPDDAGVDSVSILPALLGTDAKPLREAVVHHSINGRFSIRQGPWKLELCPGSGGWSKPNDKQAAKDGLPATQLYKLDTDIGESANLQAEHPEKVAELSKILDRYISSGRSTPGPNQPNDSPIRIPSSK